MRTKMNDKKLTVIKYAVAVVVVATIVLLGNYIERTPLYSRGIVLGLALDKTDKGVSVIAQTVVNGNSTTPGAASAYDLVEGEGKELAEALEEIAQKSGLLPSFAHCQLLIVGKEYLEDGFDQAALTLFEKTLIQDNTRVIASEGKAKDIIKASVPIVSTTSEYITNDLKINAEEGSSCVVTLKDYVQRIPEGNGTKLLTVAKKIDANPPTSSENGKQSGEFNFFDLLNLVAFDENGSLHFYDKDVALARSLIKAKKMQFITVSESDVAVSAEVLSTVKNTKIINEKELSTDITYYVKIKEKKNIQKSQVTDTLREEIIKTIKTAFDKTLDDNVDLFSLKGILTKKYGDKSKDIPLKDVVWKVKVSVVER